MLARHLLITAATGTVGSAVAQALAHTPAVHSTRHRDRVTPTQPFFDLDEPTASAPALIAADVVFLLMPPGLSDAAGRFRALLDEVPSGRLPYLVFMSVQGAGERSFLPHAKVEQVIRERALREPGPMRFTLLRPSYFMQNLENAFGDDLRLRHEIVVPAGRAKFVWVDADDIGRAAAAVMLDPAMHAGKAYTITGTDVVGFTEVAQTLSRYTPQPITYRSLNPIRYYLEATRRGTPKGMAIAQTLIHFVERFTATPGISADYTYLTGRKPTSLADYLKTLAVKLQA